MSIRAIPDRHVLIFVMNPSMSGVGRDISSPGGIENPWGQVVLLTVARLDEALRHFHRHDALLVLVCVGHAGLEESAALIGALRRRRPQLPLLAIASGHDMAIELAVRVAGASYYFALDEAVDARLFRRTLEALGCSCAPGLFDERMSRVAADERPPPGPEPFP